MTASFYLCLGELKKSMHQRVTIPNIDLLYHVLKFN